MIFLIHGNNLEKTRDQILKIKQKLQNGNTLEFNIENLSQTTLITTLGSQDIFSSKPLVIVDITKSTAGEKNLLNILVQHESQNQIILWATKELPKNNIFLKELNLKTKKSIFLNKEEIKSNVFKFVDYVIEKDEKKAFEELKALEETEDPIYLLAMLVYGYRNLLIYITDSKLMETTPPFVRSKLKKQAAMYTLDMLLKIYELLYNLDLKVKTGKVKAEFVLPYTIKKIMLI